MRSDVRLGWEWEHEDDQRIGVRVGDGAGRAMADCEQAHGQGGRDART